jgi:cytochrome c5
MEGFTGARHDACAWRSTTLSDDEIKAAVDFMADRST